MSDEQWKPDPKSAVQKRAKSDGFRITYEALDIPPEPKEVVKARKKWIKERYWRSRPGNAS